MKFLQQEYKGLKRLIDSSSLRYRDFRFVKRRGRIHVFYKSDPSAFVFFRRKVSEIRDGNFVNDIRYEQDAPVREVYRSLDEMLEAFSRWLEDLNE